jgi:hypothetical protein
MNEDEQRCWVMKCPGPSWLSLGLGDLMPGLLIVENIEKQIKINKVSIKQTLHGW